MRTARLLAIFFVLLGLFLLSALKPVAAANDTGKPPATSDIGGFFFDPTDQMLADGKYKDPAALSYFKFGPMALNVSLREVISQIVGSKPVVQANGQVFKAKGAVDYLGQQIAFMTTTPAVSGTDYVAYNLNKLSVPGVKPAYAAPSGIGGVGYRSLFPVLQLWTLTRNIAYLFFAIIFVIVGVMIMLGRKLDPKTVLTVQAALPKIVLSLILVTFSYAIAGFVIDLMYVSIGLMFSVLAPLLKNNPTGDADALYNSIKNGDILFIFFTKTPWLSTFQGIAGASGDIADQIFMGLGGVVSHILGEGVGVIISLVIAVAIFYSLFKIWLKLIMTYVQIILSVVTGPFVIMFDAFPKPGQNHFTTWFKGLLGNVLIYPVTILMLLVSMIITAGVGNGGVGDGSFIAPLTGIGNVSIAQAIIGLGMLLSIPGFLDKVPGLVGAGKGIGEQFGNMWQDPLKNNWLSKTAADNKKIEDSARAGYRQKLAEKRIDDKHHYGKVDAPTTQVDPTNAAHVNNMLSNAAASNRLRLSGHDLVGADGRFNYANYNAMDSAAKRSVMELAVADMQGPAAWGGMTDEAKQSLVDQYEAAFQQVAVSQSAWSKYAADVKEKEDHEKSFWGRLDRAVPKIQSNVVSRIPFVNWGNEVAGSVGGGGK